MKTNLRRAGQSGEIVTAFVLLAMWVSGVFAAGITHEVVAAKYEKKPAHEVKAVMYGGHDIPSAKMLKAVRP